MATDNEAVGPPRLDPYMRVLHRFYEPLILLQKLAPHERDYVSMQARDGTTKAVRRRFLTNLAYSCDYQKGGDTTTAVALSRNNDSFCFWIAQNAGVSAGCRSFLAGLLEKLKTVGHLPLENAPQACEDDLLDYCLSFSGKRIRKERAFLLKSLRSCIDRNINDKEILELLERIEACSEPVEICLIAFRARHINLRHITTDAIQLLSDESTNDGKLYHVSNVRHRIGRLAHHVRVVKQLIDDSRHQTWLLDQYSVSIAPFLESINPLLEDNHTTIDGILKRMLPKDDPKLKEYIGLLEHLDQKFHIFDKGRMFYQRENRKHRVHCEIQILEHFYNAKLEYFEEDRYIGCSKKSCLCCRLYFQHHPANCIEPESHQKVCPNWSPPKLAGGAKDQGFVAQRLVLNKMNVMIRGLVIDAMNTKHREQVGKEDSTTQISSTTHSFKTV